MRPLLVLRPEPGASDTAAAARALGLEAVVAPLFRVVPLAWEPPDPAAHDALMLTSASAVRHAGPALARFRALPAYAVGHATAAAARAAGLRVVHEGATDAAALLAAMAAGDIARPLHLAGREHRAARHPALAVTRRLVYAAEAVAALPEAAGELLERGAVALLHSPRAAASFAALVADPASVRIAAISPAAATAAGEGWAATAIARAPTDAALLAAAAGLCEERG